MTSDPSDLKKTMMEIVKAIEDAGVPDDLRVAAFEKAFEAMLQSKSGVNVGGPAEGGSASKSDGANPVTFQPLHAVAKKLRLEPELVNEIYFVDGDSLSLAISPSKLDPTRSGGTQQIALLIAAGRQAGGWDEWTHVRHIRDVARDYNRFDTANFATTIKRMADTFGFRGRGRDVEVRVTRPGFEHAADLVRELGE